MAPAGTPRPVVEKLAGATKAAMHAPDVVETMSRIGYEPYDSGPDHAGAFLRAEIERWSQVARTAGIKS
jgi:tripartite-type tricarboxylate transporter receptor subunit TctC